MTGSEFSTCSSKALLKALASSTVIRFFWRRYSTHVDTHVVQSEQARLIQAFVEPALERRVSPTRSLNFFHQSSKAFSIPVSDRIFDRYCDWPVLVFREDGEIVCRIHRKSNLTFRSGRRVC